MLKSIALRMISTGMPMPEIQISRVLELSALKRLLREMAIDCVVDVGANRGQYASDLRDIGFSGRIISFEPLATEFSTMKARFAGDRLWSGHQCALGTEDGTAELHIPHLTVLSSLRHPLGPQNQLSKAAVQVRRLDSFEIQGSRIFLKMDTQGFDLEVFRGATRLLPSIVGLQSEISVKPLYAGMPHYRESLAEYERAGFVLHDLSTVSKSEDGGIIELNCLMRLPSS